jgi:DNA-binding Lrp family transcriptional regulator
LPRNDNLQLRILRELASPSTFRAFLRPTYSDIAKKLGIDEETVRVRVKRAQQAGTIIRWRLEINPHLWGCEAASVVLEVNNPSLKPSIISQIKLIDEVILIMDFYEKPLRVEFFYENNRDRERKLALIKGICDDRNPITWERSYPPCNAKLKKTDWQILETLSKDSMQSNAEIAREIGVSTRTVKRRLSFMIEARAISVQTMGDVKRVPGMAYFFLMQSPNEKQKREADEMILSRLENAIFVDARSKQYSIFSVVFHNMGEAEEMYRWMKSLSGTENTKMYVMREIIPVPDWLENELVKRVNESSK